MLERGAADSHGGAEVKQTAGEQRHCWGFSGREPSPAPAGREQPWVRAALLGEGRDHPVNPEGFTQQHKVKPSSALLQTCDEVRSSLHSSALQDLPWSFAGHCAVVTSMSGYCRLQCWWETVPVTLVTPASHQPCTRLDCLCSLQLKIHQVISAFGLCTALWEAQHCERDWREGTAVRLLVPSTCICISISICICMSICSSICICISICITYLPQERVEPPLPL